MEIKKLTPDEIQELSVDAAQRVIAENTSILSDIDNEMFIAVGELGESRIKVEQLKNNKSTIIEINRALKSVISGG